jgi:hypothetical protein
MCRVGCIFHSNIEYTVYCVTVQEDRLRPDLVVDATMKEKLDRLHTHQERVKREQPSLSFRYLNWW